MDILVNKTARVIGVDSYMLIPGVAKKVRDLSSLLSSYPGFKALVDDGSIEVMKTGAVQAADVAVAAEDEDEPKRRRTAPRKKE